MSDDSCHYPPELLKPLVEVIPLLCRSKPDVVSFLRAGGTPANLLTPIQQQLNTDHKRLDPERKKRTYIHQLEALGYKVTIKPAA